MLDMLDRDCLSVQIYRLNWDEFVTQGGVWNHSKGQEEGTNSACTEQ